MTEVLYPNDSCMAIAGLMHTALSGCSVKLFSNALPLTPGMKISDLVECTFGGYVAKVVATLLPVYLDPDGGASFQIPTQQWNCDGTGVGEIVNGFWVETSGTTPVLYLAGTFDPPVPMSSIGDALPLDVKFNFGAGQP